jgi:Tubulin-tyrosine ligase family
VHLTNYSLNKKNSNFDDNAHKLKVSECLSGTMTQPSMAKGKQPASRSAQSIWDEIETIIVKTVMTV